MCSIVTFVEQKSSIIASKIEFDSVENEFLWASLIGEEYPCKWAMYSGGGRTRHIQGNE